MIKKSVAMLAIASLVLTACKENAALRIDEAAAKQAESAHSDAGKTAEIKFETTDHDFGTINEGDKVEHVYKFTNTGTADLVVTSAKPSCGCTVPSYTQTPVKPGESGEIKAVFDSNGKTGQQQKSITVSSNAKEASVILNFKADITPKAGSGITTPTQRIKQ